MITPLDDLSLLVTIADHDSFTAAARVIDLQTSMLSRRLSAWLRTTLFHRFTRAVALVEDGRCFYTCDRRGA